MLEYKEIRNEDMLTELAKFNIDEADLTFIPREEMVRRSIANYRNSRCIGIYDEGRLCGSIIVQPEPPFQLLHIIPKENAEAFYEAEKVSDADCAQIHYAVFPGRTADERLEFYRRVLQEMIAPGKEYVLIFYLDDRFNRHRLYRRLMPEIIAQKSDPAGFTLRLAFSRRSYLLKELARVEEQIAQRARSSAREMVAEI